jgi:hypothetical protein
MSSSKATVEALSGGFGSLVATILTYPLKNIYTLQVRIAHERHRRTNDACSNALATAAR